MALKGFLTLALAGTTFLTALAVEASPLVNKPGRGGVVQPIPPGPTPPGFGENRGGRGPDREYGREQYEEKTAVVGRRLVNEELRLLQLLNLGQRNYSGHSVEEVAVTVRRGGPRAMLRLMVNGREDDRADLYSSRIVLRPRSAKTLSLDLNTLRLRVDGQAFIDTVTVILKENRVVRPDRPAPGDRVETVNFNIRTRLLGNSRIELMRLIDTHRYNGYRIISLNVDASALHRAALIDLVINGRAVSPSVTVSPSYQSHRFTPNQAVIGVDVRGLELVTRGDIDIHNITMVIARR